MDGLICFRHKFTLAGNSVKIGRKVDLKTADLVFKQPRRVRITVARCTVQRWMKYMGLQGVRRGKVARGD